MRGLQLFVGVSAALVLAACGSSSDSGAAFNQQPTAGAGGTSSQGTGGASAGGDSSTGGAAPSCAAGKEVATGACYPTDKSCGIPGSSCMARVENCGDTTKTFRLSQLRVTSPSVLATSLVEFTILGPGIDLPLPACNFGSSALGSFNWLLSLDTTAMTLQTGGAAPVMDADDGYCFLSKSYTGGMVQPATAPFAVDADGTYKIPDGMEIPKLVVPIFVDMPVSYPPVADPILLPISQAKLASMTISDNDNCIGKYNGDTLTAAAPDNCAASTVNPKLDTSYQWTDGGTLTGYITLEEADKVVIVSDSNISLCVLLTNKTDANNPKVCPRDASGNLTVKGDTSSVGNPGSMDSYGLNATFAASAIKVNSSCP